MSATGDGSSSHHVSAAQGKMHSDVRAAAPGTVHCDVRAPAPSTVHSDMRSDTAHSSEILAQLNCFRLESRYTDATLCVGDIKFPCHKNVLAVSSEFFDAMFSSSLRESREGLVELKDISADTVRHLLNYVYTGRIDVDRENAQDILAAASLYRYPAVVSTCCQFISRSLDPSNCLGIEAFARHHDCAELRDEARRYIYEHFASIAEGEEFRELSLEVVEGLVADELIDVRSEEMVFESVVRWIDAEAARSPNACRLMSHVRFVHVDHEYVDKSIRTNAHVASCPVCSLLVTHSIAYNLATSQSDQSIKLGNKEELLVELGKLCDVNEVIQARPSTIAKEVMVIVGGVSDRDGLSVLQSVEAYDPLKNKWFSLPSLPVAVKNFSATSISNDIFVIGGEVDNIVVTSVWRFLSNKRRWEAAPPLISPRSCHASAAWENRLYVIGGLRQSDNLDAVSRSIECLDLSATTLAWQVVVREIPFPRHLSQVIAYSTSLVEVGGTVNRFPMKKMEIYECNKDGLSYSGEQYVLFAEIQYGKFVFLDGYFYIVWEDDRRVIAMSPTKRTYKQVASLGHSHVHGGATVVRHRLHVAGGLTEKTVSSTVERYDQDKNTWTLCAPMLAPRARHGCVTISIS